MYYLYDGSLTGLFCTLQHILENDLSPTAISPVNNFTPSLFVETTSIQTTERPATKLADYLYRLGGRTLFRNLILVFLSETPGCEMKIYQYLCLAIAEKKDPGEHVQHPAVAACHSIWQKVQREVHRFQGFLRFEALEDDLLWANFAPEANIGCMLAPYFSRRMPNEKFMICDVKRGIGFYYHDGEIEELEIEATILKKLRANPSLRNHSDVYAHLWRHYFREIAISERRNPRLQKSLMPRKYWLYLTEKARLNNFPV